MQAREPSYSSFLMRRRHTKPCRYFQEGGCNKSAEECPFAHVYIRPAAPDANQRPRPCKYYIAGYCDVGQRCRFLHGDDTSRFLTPLARPQPRANETGLSPIIPNRNVTSGYQSDTSAFSESYPPSEPSIATSDDVSIETASHPDSEVDRIGLGRPSFDMTTPMIKSFREKRRHNNERRRASKYKTKPCKYFNTPEGCPAGDLCTFIHAKPMFSTVEVLHASPDVQTKPLSPLAANKMPHAPHGPWRVISGGVTFGGKLPARKLTITRPPPSPPPVVNSAENTELPPTPIFSPKPVRPHALTIRTMAMPQRPTSAPPSTARSSSKEGRSMFAAEA